VLNTPSFDILICCTPEVASDAVKSRNTLVIVVMPFPSEMVIEPVGGTVSTIILSE
jgi:hypothetical protein